jgi:hypothetical protein
VRAPKAGDPTVRTQPACGQLATPHASLSLHHPVLLLPAAAACPFTRPPAPPAFLQGPRYSIPYFVNPKLNYSIQGPNKRWGAVTGFDLLSKTGECRRRCRLALRMRSA